MKTTLALIVSFTGFCVLAKRNNVCPTIAGYLDKDTNKDCFYNPDVHYRAPELIKYNGYKFETHYTITDDGYKLTMFRIFPKGTCTKGIVYLQHSVVVSCEVWIDKGNRSFAFLLAERGYEVWLGNFRGVSYSLEHVRYSASDSDFWDWSFHEYGIYDIPAMTNKIRSVAGKGKFFYFGHSASTSAALVYASLFPKHAEENYNLISLWAVVAHLEHVAWFYKAIAPFADSATQFLTLVRHLNLTPHYGLLHKSVIVFCIKLPINMGLCVAALQLALGEDWNNFDPLTFPSMVYHSFEGFSMKVQDHNAQIITQGGRFQFFDYKDRNVELYNSSTPPLYPMENVRTPLHFVCMGRDTIAAPEDCQHILEQVPQQYRKEVMVIDEYNHPDVFYAKTIVERLYLPSIDILDNYNNSCN